MKTIFPPLITDKDSIKSDLSAVLIIIFSFFPLPVKSPEKTLSFAYIHGQRNKNKNIDVITFIKISPLILFFNNFYCITCVLTC